MKLPFRARPTREELSDWPLQVIARDFPETLVLFREHGVGPVQFGDQTVRDLPDRELLLKRLEARTAWRPSPVRA